MVTIDHGQCLQSWQDRYGDIRRASRTTSQPSRRNYFGNSNGSLSYTNTSYASTLQQGRPWADKYLPENTTIYDMCIERNANFGSD